MSTMLRTLEMNQSSAHLRQGANLGKRFESHVFGRDQKPSS